MTYAIIAVTIWIQLIYITWELKRISDALEKLAESEEQ